MSGIAVIVPKADFSKKNYGAVNILSDLSIKKLSISGDSVLQGEHFIFDIVFSPVFTNQTDVRWSILEGSEYASINSDTGELTINETANKSSVTIRVESLSNPNIYDTKMLTVTYEDLEDVFNGMEISGTINAVGSSIYSIKYAPENTSYKGVTWSISDGSECASINQKGELTVSREGYVKIKATSNVYPDIFTTKIVHVEPKDETLVYNLNELFIGGKNKYIDTKFIPFESENQEWTIITFFFSSTKNTTAFALSSDFSASPYDGFAVYHQGFNLKVKLGNSTDEIKLIENFQNSQGLGLIVGVSKNKENKYNICYLDLLNYNINQIETEVYHQFVQSNLSVLIGARRSSNSENSGVQDFLESGTVESTNIYNCYLNSEQLKEKISKIVNFPEIKSLSYSLNQAFIGNSFDKYLNTGIKLLLNNTPFSLIGKIKIPGDFLVSDSPFGSTAINVVCNSKEKAPYSGISIGLKNYTTTDYINAQIGIGKSYPGNTHIKDTYVWFMLTKTKNIYSFYVKYASFDEITTIISDIQEDSPLINLPLLLCAQWKGVIESDGLFRYDNAEIAFFQAYSYILTKEEFQLIINKNK